MEMVVEFSARVHVTRWSEQARADLMLSSRTVSPHGVGPKPTWCRMSDEDALSLDSSALLSVN
jgi:hypothetical protein